MSFPLSPACRAPSSPRPPIEQRQALEAAMIHEPAEEGAFDLNTVLDKSMMEQGLPPIKDLKNFLACLFKACVEKESMLGASAQEVLQKRRSYQAAKDHVLQFCQKQGIALPTQNDEPVIITRLEFFAREQAARTLLEKQKELILNARPIELVQATPTQEISPLYQKCAKELKEIRTFEHQLTELLEKAKIPEDIQRDFAFEVLHSKNERAPLRIRVTTIPMGFSIFELLLSLDIVQGDYQAEEEFLISQEALTKLSDHIEQILLWYEDFGMVFGELLTQDSSAAHQFYHIAYKPMREVIANPLHMSARAKSLLRSFESSCIILFNQIGINLTTHPQRDFFKRLIQDFYAVENMIGANGKPKEFMHQAPYLSILNTRQVQQICPHLNKQLAMQRLAFDFFGVSSWDAVLPLLKDFGLSSELEIFKQNKSGLLQLICSHLVPIGLKQHRSTAQQMEEILTSVYSCSSVLAIETISKRLCTKMLNERTGVTLKSQKPSLQISQEQKLALYRGGAPLIQLDPGVPVKNVVILFSVLDQSPLMQTCLASTPDFRDSIVFLKEEFTRRFHTYPTLQEEGFYGKKVFREAVDYFEDFVARIAYAHELGLTQKNIEEALHALVGICNADLRNCSEGFAGRIQSLLIALNTLDGNESLENAISSGFCTKAQEIFYQLAGAQSSHDVKHLRMALKFLGDKIDLPCIPYDHLSPFAKQIVGRVLSELSPMIVYETAYTWIINRFWELNRECEHEKIYQLLADLGFGEDRELLDKLFRVYQSADNNWQYAFFQQALPEKLARYLVAHKYLFIKENPCSDLMFQHDDQPAQRVVLPALLPQPAAPAPFYRPPAPAAAAARPQVDASRNVGFNPQSGLPKAEYRSG